MRKDLDGAFDDKRRDHKTKEPSQDNAITIRQKDKRVRRRFTRREFRVDRGAAFQKSPPADKIQRQDRDEYERRKYLEAVLRKNKDRERHDEDDRGEARRKFKDFFKQFGMELPEDRGVVTNDQGHHY